MNAKSLKVVTRNQTVNAQNSNSYCCFDQKLQDAIHCKARKLVGHYGFTESDVVDIEQELAIEIINSHERYDKLKSKLETFINQVCENKIKDIIRKRTAKCRNIMQTEALFAELNATEEKNISFIDNIPAASDGYPGMYLDIEIFVNSLSAQEKDLLELLRTMSQVEIIAARGILQSTLNYRISQLRNKIKQQVFYKFI